MRSYHRQRLALLHKAAQHRMEHEALQGLDGLDQYAKIVSSGQVISAPFYNLRSKAILKSP